MYLVCLAINYPSYVIGWIAIGLGMLGSGIILAQWVLEWNRDRRERREMRNAGMRVRMEGV